MVLLLNNRGGLLGEEIVSKGTVNGTMITQERYIYALWLTTPFPLSCCITIPAEIRLPAGKIFC